MSRQSPTDPDRRPVELGLRFRVSESGTVTAIRFLKTSWSSRGDFVGHLWSSDGRLLSFGRFCDFGHGMADSSVG